MRHSALKLLYRIGFICVLVVKFFVGQALALARIFTVLPQKVTANGSFRLIDTNFPSQQYTYQAN